MKRLLVGALAAASVLAWSGVAAAAANEVLEVPRRARVSARGAARTAAVARPDFMLLEGEGDAACEGETKEERTKLNCLRN